MGKIIGYFHIANMYGGSLIAAEIHGRIMQSGLYDITDKINVVMLGNENESKFLADNIFDKYPKYHIVHVSSNLNEWEWASLKRIQSDAELSSESYNLWYIHTKGASNCRPDVPVRIQNNIRDWRELMSYFIIGKHQSCLKCLDIGYDAVGALLWEERYYMGNWWWTKRDYIARLPKITQDMCKNRNDSEGWIGECNPKKLHNLHVSPVLDLYDFSNVYGDVGPLNSKEYK